MALRRFDPDGYSFDPVSAEIPGWSKEQTMLPKSKTSIEVWTHPENRRSVINVFNREGELMSTEIRYNDQGTIRGITKGKSHAAVCEKLGIPKTGEGA